MKLPLKLGAFTLVFAPLALSAAVKWNEINKQSPEWYASTEARTIAVNIVQYQKAPGGWTKNRSMLEPPAADYLSSDKTEDQFCTIDNDATTTQVRYLALVVNATHDETLREPFLRGLDYLLAAQYPNGGWPQFFPLRKGYYAHITYNDDAMVEVLDILRDVAAGDQPYGFVDEARRAKAADAVKRGIDCILRTQVRQEGKLTVWCAQHDEITLAPAPARNFEPISLSGSESVGIVRFLMQEKKPTPEIEAAIQGAVHWFEANAVNGLRLESSQGADGQRDLRAVVDPSAKRLWARFYEIGTNKPIYTGRDKVIRYDYNEIERERRTGYGYLGTWPEKLLTTDYPKWQAKHHL